MEIICQQPARRAVGCTAWFCEILPWLSYVLPNVNGTRLRHRNFWWWLGSVELAACAFASILFIRISNGASPQELLRSGIFLPVEFAARAMPHISLIFGAAFAANRLPEMYLPNFTERQAHPRLSGSGGWQQNGVR